MERNSVKFDFTWKETIWLCNAGLVREPQVRFEQVWT
jgi:hypothetical protein